MLPTQFKIKMFILIGRCKTVVAGSIFQHKLWQCWCRL